MIRWISLALIILCPVSWVIAGDAPQSSQGSRPAWCQPGWQCLRNAEVTDATMKLIDLQEQVIRLKRRARWFGCAVGPGIGISGVVTDNWSLRAVPAGHVGLTCGLVF